MSRDDALARIKAKARIKAPKSTPEKAPRYARPGEVREPTRPPIRAEIPQHLSDILPNDKAQAIEAAFPGRIVEIRSEA